MLYEIFIIFLRGWLNGIPVYFGVASCYVCHFKDPLAVFFMLENQMRLTQ